MPTLEKAKTFKFHDTVDRKTIPENIISELETASAIKIIIDVLQQKLNKTGLENKLYFLQGRCGSGKSTLMINELYNQFIRNSYSRIVCTEPRISLAIGNAFEVCKYSIRKLGFDIGYSTGDAVIEPNTNNTYGTICYYTTQKFAHILNKVVKEEDSLVALDILKRYKIIVIDEVHTMDNPIIYILFLIKKVLEKYADRFECPLFIFTSATIDIQGLLTYYLCDNVARIDIQKRLRELYGMYHLIGYVEGNPNFDVELKYLNRYDVSVYADMNVGEAMAIYFYNNIYDHMFEINEKIVGTDTYCRDTLIFMPTTQFMMTFMKKLYKLIGYKGGCRGDEVEGGGVERDNSDKVVGGGLFNDDVEENDIDVVTEDELFEDVKVDDAVEHLFKHAWAEDDTVREAVNESVNEPPNESVNEQPKEHIEQQPTRKQTWYDFRRQTNYRQQNKLLRNQTLKTTGGALNTFESVVSEHEIKDVCMSAGSEETKDTSPQQPSPQPHKHKYPLLVVEKGMKFDVVRSWRYKHRNEKRILFILYGRDFSQAADQILLEKVSDVPFMSNTNEVRIFVSTPVIESGKTISTLYYCIDSGLEQTNYRSPMIKSVDNGMRLYTIPISKNQAIQRLGRVGRTAKGKCLRFYTQEAYIELMHQTEVLEIIKSYNSNDLVKQELLKDATSLVFNPMSNNDYYIPINTYVMQRTLKNFIEHGWVTPEYVKTCSVIRSSDDSDSELELAQQLHLFYGYGLFSSFILASVFKYKLPNDIDMNSIDLKKLSTYIKTLYEKSCLTVDDITNIFNAKEKFRLAMAGSYENFIIDETRLWF